MSDTVLSSQKNSGSVRKEYSAHLTSRPSSVGPKYEMTNDIRYINSRSTVGWDREIEFDLPNSCLINDLFIEWNLGDLSSSGAYSEYPGLAIVQSIRLMSGSNTVEQFDYDIAMEEILKQEKDLADHILELAGGTSFDTGYCISPIPVFFSALVEMSKGKESSPYDVRGLRDLRLVIRVRDVSEMSSAGTATIDAKLFIDEINTNCPVDNSDYHGTTYQTLHFSTAVATNTQTTLDITPLTGNLRSLSVIDRLVADYDTNYDYFTPQGDVDQCYLRLDGKDYYNAVEQSESQRYLTLLKQYKHINNDYKLAQLTFGQMVSKHHSGGSLNTNHFNDLRLIMRHQGGANCYISVCATKECVYKVVDGYLVRQD